MLGLPAADVKMEFAEILSGSAAGYSSFGGVMGIGDKLFAVPMQALKVDPEARQFVLNVDKDALKDAPGFDKNDWPNTSDPEWHSNIDSYYDF